MYDSNPDDGSYSQYTAGRLAEIKYPAINYQVDTTHSGSTTFTDMFSYTQAGQVAGKRLRVTKQNGYGSGQYQTGVGDLNLAYGYNNEGKLTGATYPTDANSTTPSYTYSYDGMMRMSGMTTNDGGAGVSGVQYNPQSRLTSISYYGASETRSYNSLMQLTNITGGGVNLTYNYASGSNNGKITSMTDSVSGETVTYQYDSLNRLISAAGSGWTQSQAYDGFGNLAGRTGTGTAQSTSISTPADPNTNRLSGYTYDANGNQVSTGYGYDVENRIVSANAGAVLYFYDGQNKRIWQGNISNGLLASDVVTMFGADGKQIVTYQPYANWNNTQTQLTITFQTVTQRAYFGGKLVGQLTSGTMQAVVQDRLGSVGKYYPYGEERNAPQLPNDQVKFATYTRDSATGNDYADQRYYSSTFGRFMTPDPYKATTNSSIDAKNPPSWNRYAYTIGEPINLRDPRGWAATSPDEDEDQSGEPPPPLVRPPTPAPSSNPADCMIQLRYRPVDASDPVLKYFNHSYLYLEDQYGSTFIVEGFAEHPFDLKDFPSFWGNLIVARFDLGRYSPNSNQAGGFQNDDHPLTDSHAKKFTLKQSTAHPDICEKVTDILGFAQYFNRLMGGPVAYGPSAGPNSNSVVHLLLDLTSLTGFFDAPPSAPGWLDLAM